MTHLLHRLECVTRHAQLRAIQRLGCNPPAAVWLQAVRDILDRRCATLLHRSDRGGGERWLVNLGGVAVKVIWLPDISQLRTLYEAESRQVLRPLYHAPLSERRLPPRRVLREEAGHDWRQEAIGQGG